jgi:hypothetical protein
MDHMNLNDELRKQLLESAAWGKVGIDMDGWEYVDAEGVEQLEESTNQQVAEEEEAEVHVCPLCVSQLSEAIDEDALVEHLDVVLGLVDRLSQLNEGEEDVESVIDETLYDLLVGDEEA